MRAEPPHTITGANADGPRPLPMGTPRTAGVAPCGYGRPPPAQYAGQSYWGYQVLHLPLQSHPGRSIAWIALPYRTLKLAGCASHSGHPTCITRAARYVSEASDSRRDVQPLTGHTSLCITPRYIDGDTDANRTRITLI